MFYFSTRAGDFGPDIEVVPVSYSPSRNQKALGQRNVNNYEQYDKG